MKQAFLLSATALLAASLASAQQPAPSTAPAAPATVAPKPITPAPLDKPKPKNLKLTDIKSESSIFDNKTSTYTFSGNVDVRNPDFHLTTDGTFEVKMKKEEKKPEPEPSTEGKGKGKDTPAPPVKPDAKSLVEAPVKTPENGAPAAPPEKEESSVESAVATGKMVVIEKMGDDGKMKVGQSRYAHYDGKTGDMTLRDWPQVSDGESMIIATEPTTIIILTAAGKLITKGPTETRIVQKGDKPGAKAAPGPGPGTATGGGLSLPTPRPAQ